jgi:hypothetical protein
MEGRKPCLHGHPLPSWCAIAYLVTILAWERGHQWWHSKRYSRRPAECVHRRAPWHRARPPRTAETRSKKLLFATREAPPLASKRVERHLSAVPTADVAGYSRLMGSDEEGTLARLKARRRALIDPKIVEHRGQLLKSTGDGMLVEFVGVVTPFAPLLISSGGWSSATPRWHARNVSSSASASTWATLLAMGTTSSATARTSPLVLKESRSQATFASPKLPTCKGRWRRGCFSAGLTAYRSSVRLLVAPG